MKVLINEEQQDRLKLMPFIYKAISTKRTSLGDNPAFPPYGEFGFEYDVVKRKYEELDEIINSYIENGELESKEPEYLLSVLSKKFERCKKIEEPIRPQLQKLCENIVTKTLSVPSETIILKCRLVGKIKPKNSMRILPEDTNEDVGGYDFEDVEEVELTNKVILKRRFVDSLIQGLSYNLSTEIDEWRDEVDRLNSELWGLWRNIIHISNYLLFVKEEKISEKNPMQTSYVEVNIGKRGKKTTIDAQGLIFPYLLKEVFRGFLELFSSHGLPEDNKKAMYVIRKADFIVAEPWDLRLGMGIADMLDKSLTDKYQTGLLANTNRIPFFFTELCSLPTDEFNMVIKNFILGTKKGGVIAKNMDLNITHDEEYQKFKDKIHQKNIDKSLISDGDFSKEELDSYVIQENEMDEMMGYHGSGADFDKFNHKKYLSTGAGSQTFGWGTYVTNDKEVANGYVDASKDKGEGEFFINLDPRPYLESLGEYDEETINEILETYNLEVVRRFKNDDSSTINDILHSINEIIDYYQDDISCYLSVDELIEMYNDDPKFSDVPNDKKNAEIEKHRILMAKKERPIIIFNACLDIIKRFKPEMDEFLQKKLAYLYEVDIPDDNGQNYIEWYEYFPQQFMRRVIEGFLRLHDKHLDLIAKNNYSFRCELYKDIQWMKENPDRADVMINIICNSDNYDHFFSSGFYTSFVTNEGKSVYGRLRSIFKSAKAASLFLMQCGFDGIKYPSGTRWKKPDGASEDAYNYVIFDANKVKIVNKSKI